MQVKYEIYQMKKSEAYYGARYMGYNMVKKEIPYLCVDDYDKVYEGEIESKTESEMLDELYYQFNMDRPKDFTGHSLSVSDVIVLDGKAFYVDVLGFKEMDFENRKLFEFKNFDPSEDRERHFVGYGTFSLEGEQLEFDSVELCEIIDGKALPWEGYINFSGHKASGIDVAETLISKLSRNEISDLRVEFLDPKLENFVKSLNSDIAVKTELRNIPKRISYGSNLYVLECVTNQYAFYYDDDLFVMLNAYGEVKTDMEPFYTEALYYVARQVQEGKDEILYGKLSVDLED